MNLKLIRIRPIEKGFSEVILDRNKQPFEPGYFIDIKGLKGDHNQYLIASGMQEPWLRILFDDNDPFLKDLSTRYKKTELVRCFDGLQPGPPYYRDLKLEDTTFFVKNTGVSLVLSYLSTFPQRKPKSIWYYEGSTGINKDWLSKYNLVIPELNTYPDVKENIVFCDRSRI